MSESFPERLQQALAARGIRKLYAFADEIGVNKSALTRWKSGKNISIENICRLAECLDISIDWLLLGRGCMDGNKNVRERFIDILENHTFDLGVELDLPRRDAWRMARPLPSRDVTDPERSDHVSGPPLRLTRIRNRTRTPHREVRNTCRSRSRTFLRRVLRLTPSSSAARI
ncbi:helix-turn-helix transcriptional regulator [Methylobacterium sp. AMS5]|uniref:helix-turn-helix domain-containing protein n=1 Tax=Methylobacterium sp. AMS5 TaxID=925818 RepID=UPI0009FB680E|nr:helix-turn-helix transcriptional regulator [Methylobacterium sp. AMS5]